MLKRVGRGPRSAHQNFALAHVDPAPASLFLATESVFGVTFSVLFLGEILTGPLFAGFALIFAGIVISEYLPLRAEKKRRAVEAFGIEDDPERET